MQITTFETEFGIKFAIHYKHLQFQSNAIYKKNDILKKHKEKGMKKYLGGIFVAGFVALAFGIVWESYAISDVNKSRSTLQEAPNFDLLDLDGKMVGLQDYSGKIRIIDFWATWCPPCRAEIPHFNSLTQKYPDVVIIGISLDQGGVQTVKNFAKEFNIQYPILLGNIETVQAFGNIQSIPTTFVVDQNGFIIKKYVGYKPESVFEADIQKLLASGSLQP